MGIDWGSLVNSGVTLARGAQQGERERRDFERKALHELLTKQLMEAQIANFQSEAQRRADQTRLETEGRTAKDAQYKAFIQANPDLANLPPEVAYKVYEENHKSKNPTFFTDDRGNVTVSEGGGPGRPVQGVRGHTKTLPGATPKPPSDKQREKASFGVGAIQANAIINELEAQDPTISARVAKKAARHQSLIGGLGRRVLGASPEQLANEVEAQIEQSMTEDELRLYRAQKGYLSNVLPALSGKAVTAREYLMQAPAYFSMGGATPAVTKDRRRARAKRARSFLMESGDAYKERLAELAGMDLSEYGYGNAPTQPAKPKDYDADIWARANQH